MALQWDVILRHAALLGGGFALAYNAAMTLYGAGHAIAILANGGKVTRIVVHPFAGAFTRSSDGPCFSPLIPWAGVAFASAVGVPLLAMAWYWPSPWLLPFLLVGICALVYDAVGLMVDSLWRSSGVGKRLVAIDDPNWGGVAAGAVLLAAGMILSVLLRQPLGLTRDLGLSGRSAVLFLGFGPYLAAMLVYHGLFNRRETLLWAVYVAIPAVLLFALACVPSDLAAHGAFAVPSTPAPSWTCSLVMLACGTAAVTLLLMIPKDVDHVRRLAELIVLDCAKKSFSGIVFEVFDEETVLRFHSPGAVVDAMPPPKYLGDPLANAILSLYSGNRGAGKTVRLDGQSWQVTASPSAGTSERGPRFKRAVVVDVKRVE